MSVYEYFGDIESTYLLSVHSLTNELIFLSNTGRYVPQEREATCHVLVFPSNGTGDYTADVCQDTKEDSH